MGRSEGEFTVGVEEEFHVVDAQTYELRSGAPAVLAATGACALRLDPLLVAVVPDGPSATSGVCVASASALGAAARSASSAR